MKIAFLSYYSGLNFRGLETFVHELSNRLAGLGHDILVFQNGPSIKGAKYQVTKLLSPISLPPLDFGIDILFPTNGRIQSIKSKYWALVHHKKLVISGQSGPGWDDRLNLYTFPEVFTVLTDFQYRWAKKINPLVKVAKIPNGVNLSEFNPRIKPFPVNLPHPVVLYTAALNDPIKRHELLVKAVAKTSASLLLVGNGHPSELLSQLCRKLLPGRYQIMNFTHQEMPAVYTACDIFAYPTSPWESFGIAIVEAMAANLPVVANDDPIRREIVGDAGLFVNPENTEIFAQTLEKSLQKEWESKPVARAGNYNWDKIALAYSDLCKSL